MPRFEQTIEVAATPADAYRYVVNSPADGSDQLALRLHDLVVETS